MNMKTCVDETISADLKAFEKVIETGREAIVKEPSRWGCFAPALITPEVLIKLRETIMELQQESSSKEGKVTGYEYIPSRGVVDVPIEFDYRSVLEWLLPKNADRRDVEPLDSSIRDVSVL